MLDDTAANARQSQAVNYSDVTAFAFLVWELCITFPDEVDFIWLARWSPTKYAYLLLRYYTLVVTFLGQVDICKMFKICVTSECSTWFKFQAVSLELVIVFQQFIMTSRVYALYRGSCKISIILIVSFIAEHAITSIFNVLNFHEVHYDGACKAIKVSPIMVGVVLPPVLYDLVLFILTVYKCIQTAPRAAWRYIPLVWILVRDGSWAFAIVFGVFCFEGFFFFASRGPLAAFAWPWQYTAASFAACRVVLHMHRKAATSPSSARLRTSTYIGQSGLHGGGWDRAPVESEGFALTTFLPGVEFEESEPPDTWRSRVR